MMINRRDMRTALGCTLLLTSLLGAQESDSTGAAPGSQSAFINGSAAARNAHQPRIWLGRSVVAHAEFYVQAFNGPNITEVADDPDLDSALKAEVINTIFDSANLALIAASQQFLVDLAAANQDDNVSDPIGEDPLDDFFGDIIGTGSADADVDANVDDDASTDTGSELSDDELDDFFGPLGARQIDPFDTETEIDLFESAEPVYTFEPVDADAGQAVE